jgi:hypothetical protein
MDLKYPVDVVLKIIRLKLNTYIVSDSEKAL